MPSKRPNSKSNEPLFFSWLQNLDKRGQSIKTFLAGNQDGDGIADSFILKRKDLSMKKLTVRFDFGTIKIGMRFASLALCVADEEGQGSFLDEAVAIVEVAKGSYAEKAGLLKGDIILQLSSTLHDSRSHELLPALLPYRSFKEKISSVLSTSQYLVIHVWRYDTEKYREDVVNDKITDCDKEVQDSCHEEIKENNDADLDSSNIPYMHGSPETENLLLSCRLRFGWDSAYAENVFNCYMLFISIKIIEKDKDGFKLFPPCTAVDNMWREHIVDIKSYSRFCHIFTDSGGWSVPGLLHYYDRVSIEHSKHDRKKLAMECDHALAAYFGDKYTRVL